MKDIMFDDNIAMAMLSSYATIAIVDKAKKRKRNTGTQTVRKGGASCMSHSSNLTTPHFRSANQDNNLIFQRHLTSTTISIFNTKLAILA